MKRAYGFTIVELLIVIVVVAILAALSYVGYVNIQNRAHDAAVQSDLRSIGSKIGLHVAEHGAFPTNWSQLGLVATKSAYDTTDGVHPNAPPVYNLLFCRSPSSTDFALIAKSRGGGTFQYAGGSVSPYAVSVPANANVLCDGAGITGTSNVGDRRWFYYEGAWQAFVSS